jgi:hypothetical protein
MGSKAAFWIASWIAVAGLGLMSSGCAAVRSAQQSMSRSPGAADARAAAKPQVRYSAAAGVALYRKADATSDVVGKLDLHESVLRHQRRAGFAYVTSQRSGLAGWVREQQLIERLPAEEAAAPEPPPPEKSIFDPY